MSWGGFHDKVHQRPLVSLTTQTVSESPLSLSVLTWNILADQYRSNHLGYCPSEILEWDCRSKLITSALEFHNADVIALQEVDPLQLNDIKPFLESVGYAVHYGQKFRSNADGCVLAVRSEKWLIAPDDLLIVSLGAESNLPQVGLSALLKPTDSSSHQGIVVGVTHLKAPKLDEEIRCLQIDTFITATQEKFGTSTPLLVVGDMNTEPRWGMVDMVRDKFHLHDVYTEHPREGFASKMYSCYMPYEQDLVDYMFHSRSLVPTAVLQVPCNLDVVRMFVRDRDEFKKSTKRCLCSFGFENIPTASFPSDHVPLMAVFSVTA